MDTIHYMALLLGIAGGHYLGGWLKPKGAVARRLLSPFALAVVAGIATVSVTLVVHPPVNFNTPVVWADSTTVIRSEAEFDAFVAETKGRAVIDFYANWCGPCRTLAPTVSELASEGHRVAVVNIDLNRDIAERFQVQSIPTLFVVENGSIVHRTQGVHSKRELKALLAS